MEICPVCQYRDPASFQNRPLTNEMRKYVNVNNPKETAIFNSAEDTFKDAKGVEWVEFELFKASNLKSTPVAKASPAAAPKPPTIVKESAFEGEVIPSTKPVIPLPQM